MSRTRLVGVSGVDGSGKSSLVAGFVRHHPGGERPVALHVYGCVLCRRWTGRPPLSTASAAGRGGGVLARCARTLHSHVDAGEMTVRLLAAVLRSRWGGGARPVVTDRSPLDGLVKHDPPHGSLAARWYLAVARRYDTLLWLDGDCATLAARDREHSPQQLAEAQAGFDRWSALLTNVVRIDTTGSTASEVARLASGSLAGGRPDRSRDSGSGS